MTDRTRKALIELKKAELKNAVGKLGGIGSLMLTAGEKERLEGLASQLRRDIRNAMPIDWDEYVKRYLNNEIHP